MDIATERGRHVRGMEPVGDGGHEPAPLTPERKELLFAVLSAKTLCGHDDRPSKFATLDGKVVMCQDCYHVAARVRYEYMTGKARLGETRARLAPVFGTALARGYCRMLRRARIVNLLTHRSFSNGDS